MKTAKQIIIDLINSKKINGEDAYTLITSLKEDNLKYDGTISITPTWYSTSPEISNCKLTTSK